MGLDGLHGLAHGFRRVFETLQPLVEVDAALADGVERLVRHTAGYHFMVEVAVAHVARTAMRVGHHHDFLDAELVDGDDEAAHGRIKGRDDKAAGVLDNLRVAVLQAKCGREQFGQSGVHARQHGQLLVGVLAGEILLIAFGGDERLVVVYDLVNHKQDFFLNNVVMRCKNSYFA